MRSPGNLPTPTARAGPGGEGWGQGDCRASLEPTPSLAMWWWELGGPLTGPCALCNMNPEFLPLTCLHCFCSSSATTPQEGPGASGLWLLEPTSYHVVPVRSVPGQRQGRTSAPATPETQGRRGLSQSLR